MCFVSAKVLINLAISMLLMVSALLCSCFSWLIYATVKKHHLPNISFHCWLIKGYFFHAMDSARCWKALGFYDGPSASCGYAKIAGRGFLLQTVFFINCTLAASRPLLCASCPNNSSTVMSIMWHCSVSLFLNPFSLMFRKIRLLSNLLPVQAWG